MRVPTKKGVAGLNIFLGVIVMLFMIGLIVMVLSIASGRLSTTSALYADYTTLENSFTLNNDNTSRLSSCNTAGGSLTSFSLVNTSTVGGATHLTGANSSITLPCNLTLTGTSATYNTTTVNVSYAYEATSSAQDIINDTRIAIGESVDWFSTFIVLSALIVLILMVVLIVTSIRKTGYVGGESSGLGKGPGESA